MANFRIPLFKVRVPDWDVLGPALKKVAYSGYLAEGEEVGRFEKELQAFLGTPNVFATNSCTSALQIALKLSDVGPGDTVVVPPMTCVATAAPVANAGAKVLWCDVDPKTGLADPHSVSDLWAHAKAVMAVDWGGDVAPIPDLHAILKDTSTTLIEDAAQAFGTFVQGADYRCFSFQAIKLLTTADGGCLVTQTAEDAAKGKSLSWFGIDRRNFRLPTGEINWDMDIPLIGFKGNLNNVAAAIGNVQMSLIGDTLERHRENAETYKNLLQDIFEVCVAPRPNGSAYWVFTVTCDERDELMKCLQEHGIQASRMHAAIHNYTGFERHPATPENLPGVEEFASRVLALPVGWWLNEFDVGFVVERIKDFYIRRR